MPARSADRGPRIPPASCRSSRPRHTRLPAPRRHPCTRIAPSERCPRTGARPLRCMDLRRSAHRCRPRHLPPCSPKRRCRRCRHSTTRRCPSSRRQLRRRPRHCRRRYANRLPRRAGDEEDECPGRSTASRGSTSCIRAKGCRLATPNGPQIRTCPPLISQVTGGSARKED
jgi:hypothetical protein